MVAVRIVNVRSNKLLAKQTTSSTPAIGVASRWSSGVRSLEHRLSQMAIGERNS